MHTVYVIYSKTLDKYYIGETENVKERFVHIIVNFIVLIQVGQMIVFLLFIDISDFCYKLTLRAYQKKK